MNNKILSLPFISLLLLALAALFNTHLSEQHRYLPIGLSVISFALLTKWYLARVKNSQKDFSSSKGRGYTVSTSSSIILFALVLGGLALLTNRPRFNKTWDLTEHKANSLDPSTIKLISKLTEKQIVPEILGFFRDANQRQKFKDLIQLYKIEGLETKDQFFDPQSDPTLALSLKITNQNTVIIKNSTRQTKLTSFTEERVTNALMNLLKTEAKKIYYTTGHGEPILESEDETGMSLIKEELRQNKYETASISIMETGEIPNDADLLVIVGPKYDLKKQEINILHNYLMRPKPLLVLLDSMAKHDNLNQLMREFGLSFNSDLVLLHPDDARVNFIGQNQTLVSNFDDIHPATRDFSGDNATLLMLPNTRSISLVENNKNKMTPKIIGSTSDIFISVNDVLSPKDLENISEDRIKSGSFDIIAVSEGQVGGTKIATKPKIDNKTAHDSQPEINPNTAKTLRIAATGSSHLATNSGLGRNENGDMFINLVSYLLQDEDFISIRPPKLTASNLNITSIDSEIWLVFKSFIYPQIFLGMGIFFWLARRKA